MRTVILIIAKSSSLWKNVLLYLIDLLRVVKTELGQFGRSILMMVVFCGVTKSDAFIQHDRWTCHSPFDTIFLLFLGRWSWLAYIGENCILILLLLWILIIGRYWHSSRVILRFPVVLSLCLLIICCIVLLTKKDSWLRAATIDFNICVKGTRPKRTENIAIIDCLLLRGFTFIIVIVIMVMELVRVVLRRGENQIAWRSILGWISRDTSITQSLLLAGERGSFIQFLFRWEFLFLCDRIPRRNLLLLQLLLYLKI